VIEIKPIAVIKTRDQKSIEALTTVEVKKCQNFSIEPSGEKHAANIIPVKQGRQSVRILCVSR